MPDITFSSGKKSTAIPSYHLIPPAALTAYARRLERGVRLKGDGAWNAATKDQQGVMEDREFLIDRLSHCIKHCVDAIARVRGQIPPLDDQEVSDGGDAGAILFAGGLLASVDEYERLRIPPKEV